MLAVEIAISELRANLRKWVEEARAGADVVVTERGVPVARLVGIESADLLKRLERDGIISRPRRAARPRASGRRRATASGSVSELITELRS